MNFNVILKTKKNYYPMGLILKFQNLKPIALLDSNI
jgi:hypothetical protein